LDTILIVPGLGDSCPDHWQSWFEARLPNCHRVIQGDWERADLPVWTRAMHAAISYADGRVWIVAHSFGCLAAVQAASRATADIGGALLVAPADPAKFGLSAALPKTSLPFRSILVASENDPWMSFDEALRWARVWGAACVHAGRAGHINTSSGYGAWPDGLRLLMKLQNTAPRPARRHAFHEREYR
jgi:uncharacterized protein